MTIEEQFELGMSHHQAGRWAEAERIYHQILNQQGNHHKTLHRLGVLAGQAGQSDKAIEYIRAATRLCPENEFYLNDLAIALRRAGRLDESLAAARQAVAANPDYAEAYGNLGNTLKDWGRHDEAIENYQHAIRLKPDLAPAHNNLGLSLLNCGRVNEAVAAWRRAISLWPDFAEAYCNLGNGLILLNELNDGISACRRAIQLRPDLAVAHNYLGNALHKAGQPAEAIAAYREAIRLIPDYATAHSNLGNALKDVGQLDEAIRSNSRAISLNPQLADAHMNLGNAYIASRRFKEAIAAHQHAIALRPDHAVAYTNLGVAYRETGRLDEAVAAWTSAIRIDPRLAEAYCNLGNALTELGQIGEAIMAYRHAIQLKPDFAAAHGNMLLALICQPDMSAQSILEQHQSWANQHAPQPADEIIVHVNRRSPDRVMRIGYVSADFRRHSVSYFFLPLLEHHDRRKLKIFCYSNVLLADDFTERIKQSTDVWRSLVGMSDDVAVRLIRSDDIDILVDLSGQTAGNRLRVFARRAAPVQVTYLGYPNTTGIKTIDYRLTDVLADPPGMTDGLTVEKLWRLSTCAWCYQPLEETPDSAFRADGAITFGCFSAFSKINDLLLALWSELLHQVPGSRLLLKSTGAGTDSSRRRILERIGAHGISQHRIVMRGQTMNLQEHLRLYNQVDVALDTYPYHGTTTTCEALWMGVPVVTLAGTTHVSRVGVSLLTNVGLPELIAQSPQQYVQIAGDLARNPAMLAELKQMLRARLRTSPLMDAQRFAAEIEDSYRAMWANLNATANSFVRIE